MLLYHIIRQNAIGKLFRRESKSAAKLAALRLICFRLFYTALVASPIVTDSGNSGRNT